jgi:hypothetical protein
VPELAHAAPAAPIVAADRAEGMLRRAPVGPPRWSRTRRSGPLRRARTTWSSSRSSCSTYPSLRRRCVRCIAPDRRQHRRDRMGREGEARAVQFWDEERDRCGVAHESPIVARHELMNTPQKLQALLEGRAPCPSARSTQVHLSRCSFWSSATRAAISGSDWGPGGAPSGSTGGSPISTRAKLLTPYRSASRL